MNELVSIQPQEPEKDPLSVSEADLEYNFDVLSMMPGALAAFGSARRRANDSS